MCTMRGVLVLLLFSLLLVQIREVSPDEGVVGVAPEVVVGGSGDRSVAVPSFSPDEEDHIVSVTVRAYSTTPGAVIYYTLDGKTPDLNDLSVASGDSILIDAVGKTTIRAFSYLPGNVEGEGTSSASVKKVYNVLARCQQPNIVPSGGTFAGSVIVVINSETPDSHIYYTLDNTPPRENDNSSIELKNSSRTIILTSSAFLSAIATKRGMAPSAVTKSTFTIRPKVASPRIDPEQSVFAVSATLSLTCATADANIYYTIDGTLPTESSFRVDDENPQIILDQAGDYVITAFATLGDMLHSDITSKKVTILPRANPPLLHPPPGSFIKGVTVCFSCPSVSSGYGTVFYTVDGHSTPSERSPSLACGGCLNLTLIGETILRAFVKESDKSPSSISSYKYSIVRPPYDEYPVNPNATLQMRPDVAIFVVEKNIPYTNYPKSTYCGKRNIRGRLVVLNNPVGHFDVMEPENGCKGGLELPSVSGRKSWTRAAKRSPEIDHEVLPPYSSYYSPQQVSALSEDDILLWEEEYTAVNAMGCEVVTNAGFFNVSNGECFGDIVSAGGIVQTSPKHNVNFGIRNGKFVTGYVTSEEIRRSTNGVLSTFDTIVSGLGWLVREGETHVDESFHQPPPSADMTSNYSNDQLFSSSYGEDMSAQSSGRSFPTLLSARTAIGHDRDGRLLLLQVEGESWVRGLSLYEFAEFAKELGFYSAINLDGGGSATMTVNHSLISEPSWRCTDDDTVGSGATTLSQSAQAKTYCEKRVSSITCIHSMPPPRNGEEKINHEKYDGTFVNQVTPTSFSSSSPTTSNIEIAANSSSLPCPAGRFAEVTAQVSALEESLRAVSSSESFYKLICVVLGFMFVTSLLVHIYICWINSETRQRREFSDGSMGGGNGSIEVVSNSLLTSGVGGGSGNAGEQKGDIEQALQAERSHGQDYDEDNLELEDFGLPDNLDFDEFDDSDDDDDTAPLRFKKPSEMAYINQPIELRQGFDVEEEEEVEMDIETEEQTSLLSTPSTPEPLSHSQRIKKKRSKDKKSDKKKKRMMMDFSDRTYE